MTTQITLDFDTMPDHVAKKLATVIEFYVSQNFPQSLLHGSTVNHTLRPAPLAVVKTIVLTPNEDGELRPGRVVLGMGVTEAIGGDRYPGTVTRMSASQKSIWYTRDEFKRTDDNGAYSESQDYEYTSRPVTYDHDGTATNEHMARWNSKNQCYIVSGAKRALRKGRHAHFDPHF